MSHPESMVIFIAKDSLCVPFWGNFTPISVMLQFADIGIFWEVSQGCVVTRDFGMCPT